MLRSSGGPFNRSHDPLVVSAGAPPIRFFSLLKKLWGSAPRAHQGEAPENAGADPSGIPGLPRFRTS